MTRSGTDTSAIVLDIDGTLLTGTAPARWLGAVHSRSSTECRPTSTTPEWLI
jgi:hypothetical protein